MAALNPRSMEHFARGWVNANAPTREEFDQLSNKVDNDLVRLVQGLVASVAGINTSVANLNTKMDNLANKEIRGLKEKMRGLATKNEMRGLKEGMRGLVTKQEMRGLKEEMRGLKEKMRDLATKVDDKPNREEMGALSDKIDELLVKTDILAHNEKARLLNSIRAIKRVPLLPLKDQHGDLVVDIQASEAIRKATAASLSSWEERFGLEPLRDEDEAEYNKLPAREKQEIQRRAITNYIGALY